MRINTPAYIKKPPSSADTSIRIRAGSIMTWCLQKRKAITPSPHSGLDSLWRWKAEAATCKARGLGRSSTLSNPPLRTMPKGKVSKPRQKTSASPKAVTAVK